MRFLPLALLLPMAALAAPQAQPGVLRNIELFAQYSASAYCRILSDRTAKSRVFRKTTTNACEEIDDATTVLEFGAMSTISGNIAVSNSKRLIIVTFRGTSSIRDLLSDLKICTTDTQSRGFIEHALSNVCALMSRYKHPRQLPYVVTCIHGD
jgi:hypothetical protein